MVKHLMGLIQYIEMWLNSLQLWDPLPILPPACDSITLSNAQRTRNLPLKQSAVTDFSEDKCFYKAPGQILLSAHIKILSIKRSINNESFKPHHPLTVVLKNCIAEKVDYY